LETLFVTGHSGFIGSHLVDHLCNNYKIVGLGKTKLKNSKIIQINQDLTKVTSNIIPKNVSCIVHLAALTDIQHCQKNPKKCFQVNIQGTQNLLEICRKRNLKFLLLSTSHVFGFPQKIPVDEDHPRHPSSIYASSKLCGEVLCESFAKTYDLDMSIVRLFSIYGPKSPNHLVTSKIISQLLTKNVIKIGNLRTKRDFLYIDDAISAISFVLKKTKGFDSFNVGSGESHSIQDVLKTIIDISKMKVKIKQEKSILRKNDIPEIIADSKKLRKLGWRPKTKFNEGLKTTYEWFNKNYQSKNNMDVSTKV
jgi:nucleoside-diphosphate-sugar epimerase